MRWNRKGFAAPTGFRDVKKASALLAQVIDRQKKTLQRFSRFAGGFAVAVRGSALVERLIGRDLIVREQPDEGTRTPQHCATLDFCSRGTKFDVITPEVSEGKSGQGNNWAEGTR